MEQMTILPVTSRPNDDWQTPPLALDPLIPYIKPNWTIWECAEGKGNLSKALREKGFVVIGTDILSDRDFLVWEPISYDCIITNPPFSSKHQFLERAYRLRKPFAFLVPLTTFETSRRQALFSQFGIEVIMFPFRIDFEHAGKTGKSYFVTAWFTHGLNIGRQLTFYVPKSTHTGIL